MLYTLTNNDELYGVQCDSLGVLHPLHCPACLFVWRQILVSTKGEVSQSSTVSVYQHSLVLVVMCTNKQQV